MARARAAANPQVVAVATVESAPGREDELLALLETLASATHAEAACLAYAVHRDRDAPGRFAVVERWTSPVALEAHELTPHVRAFEAAVGPLLAAPPHVVRLAPLGLGDPMKGAL